MHARQLDLGALITEHPHLPPLGVLGPAVIGTWHGRMVNEWMSSFVFDSLSRQLEALGMHQDAAQARAFAEEERRHGVRCASVVEAAGGEATALVAPPSVLPEHRDTTARAAVLRNVISICCMSETVAVALIGAERDLMPDGELRVLLTEIWADEVGHARYGWALLDRMLPSLDASEHDAIVRYLPHALRHLSAHELSHLPIGSEPPIEGATFGVCSGRDARALFADTVRCVIVPELEARGLQVNGWTLEASEREAA
jgi:hypothetical protein